MASLYSSCRPETQVGRSLWLRNNSIPLSPNNTWPPRPVPLLVSMKVQLMWRGPLAHTTSKRYLGPDEALKNESAAILPDH